MDAFASSTIILDQRHEVVLQKLKDDFRRSCLHSPSHQSVSAQESGQRIQKISEVGALHPDPFAQAGWQFPTLAATLLAAHPEEANRLLQVLANQCREALFQEKTLRTLGRPQPKILVNCDCLTVGCIATLLSLTVNRNLPIHLDYTYTHAIEQVSRLNRNPDADVLITVDGSFMLAGAVDYRRIAPLHKEKQYYAVYQPSTGRRRSKPRLHCLPSSSWEEQYLLQPVGYATTFCPVEDIQAFIAQMPHQLQSDDHLVLPEVTAALASQRFPDLLMLGQGYENFVSMSIHLRWFRKDGLATSMRQFVDLFIFEWNYLRVNLLKGNINLAQELLFRDHPDVGYSVRQLLEKIQPWSVVNTATSSPAAEQGLICKSLLDQARIYVVYLIQGIFQQEGDDAILSSEEIAEKLVGFNLQELSDKTIRNYIARVEEMFQDYFDNNNKPSKQPSKKLQLFEKIHRRGYALVPSLEWDKRVETAWEIIKQMGESRHGLTGSSKKN